MTKKRVISFGFKKQIILDYDESSPLEKTLKAVESGEKQVEALVRELEIELEKAHRLMDLLHNQKQSIKQRISLNSSLST